MEENALSFSYCSAVLALDVKNVFNTTNWNRLEGALVNTSVPGLFGESGRKLPLRVDSLLRDG